MTIIVAISIIAFVIAWTVIITGTLTLNEDAVCCGWFLFVALVLIHLGFQTGSWWQRMDTLEKYNVIKISTPAP